MSKRMLYLECYAGISGDMAVAALLDLGASKKRVLDTLHQLPLEGYDIIISRTKQCGIEACDFKVLMKEKEAARAEENYIKGHEHHAHSHVSGAVHRNYQDICTMLEGSSIEREIISLAKKIFHIIAMAEAKVHGSSLEQVHFHEVGAVDSIVDIVAAAACIVDLGIEDAVVSELYEGMGTTWCQHGRIPIPAPAVVEILTSHQMAIAIQDIRGEMITPTGAAIAAAIQTSCELPRQFYIEKLGMGAGKRKYPHANVLRAFLITTERPGTQKLPKEKVWVLETNVDDCSGEQLGYTMECLLAAGAKDACCIPLAMKKNRPAYMLQVLCEKEQISVLEAIIFKETTSIGLRRYEEERSVLPRSMQSIVAFGREITMKVCRHKEQVFYYPEYDMVKDIAKETGKSFTAVYQEAVRAAEEQRETSR